MFTMFKIDRYGRQYRKVYKSLPAAKRAAMKARHEGYPKATIFQNQQAIFHA